MFISRNQIRNTCHKKQFYQFFSLGMAIKASSSDTHDLPIGILKTLSMFFRRSMKLLVGSGDFWNDKVAIIENNR